MHMFLWQHQKMWLNTFVGADLYGSMDEKSIARNLERIRLEHGYSQDETAEKLGISRNTYGNLVSGKTKIISEYLLPLAGLYGIGLDELLLGYKPVKSGERLKDNEISAFEEQRLALIKDYEKNIEDYRARLKESELTISDLRDHIKTLKGIVGWKQNQPSK